MSKLLSGSIDLSKIDKSKIVTRDKEGKLFENGAKYLNIQMWVNDEPDQYGNTASIIINQSKEEREAKAEKIYIGNMKTILDGNKPNQKEGDADDLPF